MTCVLTLEDVIFRLCQDEDVLVRVVDYETGDVLMKCAWKSEIRKDETSHDYHLYKDSEVKNISPCQFPGNIGFDIEVIYF